MVDCDWMRRTLTGSLFSGNGSPVDQILQQNSKTICIGNSMVSSAIRKKHARVSFSKTIKIARVQFEVFEKLTSACFFQIAR